MGGQRKVPMDELKALYEELGFCEVSTYIQSGNVIFKADLGSDPRNLSYKIEQTITEKFGFEVAVIIRTADEMKKLLSENPILKEKNIDTEKLHVTFLEEKPQKAFLDKITAIDYSPEKLCVTGREVYLYCPNGYGTTKLSNTFFENKLKVKATTRNWKTVNKLVELANEIGIV